jgi:hypothetical protein
MSDVELRLDGNAAAGDLAEVFTAEMTMAVCVCGHCGKAAPLGAAYLYKGGPGSVLRCSTCEGVIVRYARVRGRLMIDMAGAARLELPAL